MPITITSIADLENIGHNILYPLSGDYVLGADLDASGVTNFGSSGNRVGDFWGWTPHKAMHGADIRIPPPRAAFLNRFISPSLM